jgi:hypothetical protein
MERLHWPTGPDRLYLCVTTLFKCIPIDIVFRGFQSQRSDEALKGLHRLNNMVVTRRGLDLHEGGKERKSPAAPALACCLVVWLEVR